MKVCFAVAFDFQVLMRQMWKIYLPGLPAWLHCFVSLTLRFVCCFLWPSWVHKALLQQNLLRFRFRGWIHGNSWPWPWFWSTGEWDTDLNNQWFLVHVVVTFLCHYQWSLLWWCRFYLTVYEGHTISDTSLALKHERVLMSVWCFHIPSKVSSSTHSSNHLHHLWNASWYLDWDSTISSEIRAFDRSWNHENFHPASLHQYWENLEVTWGQVWTVGCVGGNMGILLN